ncbi:retinitis pigmentosa 9 protein isoform X5 [Myotis lucifugus]|uniref:retinitis pigmentosa 9 protein isoform X5 n=1 Tax=Myotis lucifugus TaxID=59463 RepID=UPI000CCC723A|nr:retinitis pigmentosa 9 protein isoform X5 [Myotis lucifugus]
MENLPFFKTQKTTCTKSPGLQLQDTERERRPHSYEKPPPGLIKEDETKPEDCIPDVPGNEHAREFLAHAPTKGLWMPLGKEVKVMQCECASASGTPEHTQAHEDPMYDIIRENKRHEKDIRRKMKHAEIFRIMERIQNTSTQPCRIGMDIDRNGKHEKLKISTVHNEDTAVKAIAGGFHLR